MRVPFVYVTLPTISVSSWKLTQKLDTELWDRLTTSLAIAKALHLPRKY